MPESPKLRHATPSRCCRRHRRSILDDNDARNEYINFFMHILSEWTQVIKWLSDEPKPIFPSALHQASLEVKSCTGDTPLILAAYFGHAEAAEQLLARGADKNAVDEEGHAAGSSFDEGVDGDAKIALANVLSAPRRLDYERDNGGE